MDLEFLKAVGDSDALPLTLPIAQANEALLREWGLMPLLTGQITSYASVEVPELWGLGPLALALALRRSRAGVYNGLGQCAVDPEVRS